MRTRHVWGLGVCLAVAACKSSGGGGDGGTNANCPSNMPADLISDFAVDNSLASVDGRQGGWYTYGDDEASPHYDFKLRDCERGH